MKMRDLLGVERIIPRLRARNRHDALRKLASEAARHVDVPAETILQSALKAAELPAFGPGAGVALPHAFVPGLPGPVVIFARLEPAIDFGAADGSLTDLVALLLSPAERTDDHLQALACLARTLRDSATRSLLRASKCRDSWYVILCGSEDEPLRSRETTAARKRSSGTRA